MGVFNRGFKAISEEKERQERERANRGALYRLFIKEGEADVIFLTEEPVNFYEHTIKTYRNGKEFYDNALCTGSDCQHCADGERASFKSAWLVIDLRPYEYEENGRKKVREKTLKLYVVGTKIAGVVQRKSERKGLVGRIYTIDRIGKGTDTTYSFEDGDKVKVKSKEIRDLLPEELRDMFDGTQDSLMDIIEYELEKTANVSDTAYGDDDDEDDDDSILGCDDDDEEEEEEPKPTKALHKHKKSVTRKKVAKKIKRK